MAAQANKLSRFLQELKRRKTDKVIVVYAASVFAILQLVQILQDALSLPEWTTRLIIIVSAIGFPIAAVFSWFFDIVPGVGIEKTRPLEDTEREKIESQLKTWRGITLVSLFVIVLLIFLNVIRTGIASNSIKKSEKSIAVVPFRNLSGDENAPFSGDLIATIINNGLIQVKEFAVTSSFNVMQYDTRNKSTAQIGRDLKVAFLVTGEIMKNRNQIIVSINLIKADKNKTLWGEKYIFDKEDDIDTLNDVAIRIADNLKTELSPEVKQKIKSRPTKNRIAYLNYLKGSAMQDNAMNASKYTRSGDSTFGGLPTAESYEKAIFYYDKAIAEDSTFALAYAKRSITRSWGHRADYFNGKDQQEKCENDVKHAMRIDRNLTETWIAAGYYCYSFTREYDKALGYFNEALKKDPANWQCKFSLGVVYRAAGQWAQSQKLMIEVGKDNPTDALILTNVGLSYQYLRNYDSAIYFHDKAIRVMPRWSAAYVNKIDAVIMRDGSTRKAERVMDSAMIRTNARGMRKYRILFDIYNGKMDEALLKTEVAETSDFDYQGERYLLYAQIYTYLNNPEFSGKYYKKALEYFEKLAAEKPGDAEIISCIGIASAGLNNKTKAIEYGQKAVALMDKDLIYRSYRIRDLALIFVMVGEYGKSLEMLEELLKNPSDISCRFLRLDPVWKPLWNNPGFKKLISSYSGK